MDAPSAQEASDGFPAKTSSSLSLWLVNDDPAQLMVQKRLLSRVASVQGYLSPVEALVAARSGESSPFLITDFHMPDMDGPELARVWCELHPNARVLVVSASEVSRKEQDQIDALPAGSVKLLTSYRITELQEHARTWFCEGPGATQTPPENPSTARWDRSVLEKLGQLGGPAFVSKTIARFLSGGPEKVLGIETAFAAGDLARMHDLAHALKGSCGLVGALSLANVADKIEVATGVGGDTESLQTHLCELARECQATITDLETFQL